MQIMNKSHGSQAAHIMEEITFRLVVCVAGVQTRVCLHAGDSVPSALNGSDHHIKLCAKTSTVNIHTGPQDILVCQCFREGLKALR